MKVKFDFPEDGQTDILKVKFAFPKFCERA